MKHSVRISVMALTAMLAFSTTASAQFGGLKGLANKAKKAVKEKVEDTKSEAVSSATSTVSSQAVGGKTADNNESGAAAVSFDLSDSVSWAAERALARGDFFAVSTLTRRDVTIEEIC